VVLDIISQGLLGFMANSAR